MRLHSNLPKKVLIKGIKDPETLFFKTIVYCFYCFSSSFLILGNNFFWIGGGGGGAQTVSRLPSLLEHFAVSLDLDLLPSIIRNLVNSNHFLFPLAV